MVFEKGAGRRQNPNSSLVITIITVILYIMEWMLRIKITVPMLYSHIAIPRLYPMSGIPSNLKLLVVVLYEGLTKDKSNQLFEECIYLIREWHMHL